ncbi:MAG: radical SAM protein [bacterium]|nr:radical SAM protein [bacterium]
MVKTAKNCIYPFFLAMHGCEYRCIYCDQRRTASSDDVPSPDDVTRILNREITPPGPWAVAFYGGTFTGLKRELQQEYCNAVWASAKADIIGGIRVSTRPDALNEDDITFLKDNGIATVELGVQSFDDDVLASSQRGYDAETARNAGQLVNPSGLELGLQLMPGLPGEDDASWENTVAATADIAPDFVRLYPALVIAGTPLADSYHAGEYRPLSLEEAAIRCVYAVERFADAGIRVERLGLQETTGLSDEVIAGPYHPAFGEIAYSYLMRKKIKEVIGDTRGEVTISVAPNMVSAAVGHKRMNLDYFDDKYGISVKIAPDNNKTGFEVEVLNYSRG